jgi:hypothetical protein
VAEWRAADADRLAAADRELREAVTAAGVW